MSLRLLNHGHKAVMTFGSCSLPGKKLWQDVTEASMPSAQPQSGPGEHSLHTMYKSRDGRNFMTDRLVDYSFSFFSPSSRPCHPRKAKACPSSVLRAVSTVTKAKGDKSFDAFSSRFSTACLLLPATFYTKTCPCPPKGSLDSLSYHSRVCFSIEDENFDYFYHSSEHDSRRF